MKTRIKFPTITIGVRKEPHRDAMGQPLTNNREIVRRLHNDTLETLMGICHTEPADPDACICCAAYMEIQER